MIEAQEKAEIEKRKKSLQILKERRQKKLEDKKRKKIEEALEKKRKVWEEKKSRLVQKVITQNILRKELKSIQRKQKKFSLTYLRSLKENFDVHFINDPCFKKIHSKNFIVEKRIPKIYPKYSSKWAKMIHRALYCNSFLDIPRIGYYHSFGIRCEKFCEVRHYKYLQENQKQVFKEQYEFFYKLSLDMDIDLSLLGKDEGGLDENVSKGIAGSIINRRKKSGNAYKYKTGSLEEVLERMDFTKYVDIHFILDTFGRHVGPDLLTKYGLGL